MLMIKWW